MDGVFFFLFFRAILDEVEGNPKKIWTLIFEFVGWNEFFFFSNKSRRRFGISSAKKIIIKWTKRKKLLELRWLHV